MNLGSVGISESFGLFRVNGSKPGNGFQMSLDGSVFAQFDLDISSYDLLNADYMIGIPMTFRAGAFSTRLRLYHQSSHLGDELLLREDNPDFERENISFESAEAIISLDGGAFRVYGGGEYLLRRDPPDLERSVLHGGIELRPAKRLISFGNVAGMRFVAGADVKAFGAAGLGAGDQRSHRLRVRSAARYGSARPTLGPAVRDVRRSVTVRAVLPSGRAPDRRGHSLHAVTLADRPYDVIVAGLGRDGKRVRCTRSREHGVAC